MTTLLTHKNAVIYGAGGSLDAGIATTRVEDDRVVETTTFLPDLFEAFGLPLTLEADQRRSTP